MPVGGLRRWIPLVLPLVLVAGGLATATFASSSGPGPGTVHIKTLSNRADLISGGDALLRVVLPSGASASDVRVTLNGSDVTSKFGLSRSGKFIGLVSGMHDGDNTVEAMLPDGRGARLAITNHPLGGPVFSGPQIQPWTCQS